jgi:hypothetical protein
MKVWILKHIGSAEYINWFYSPDNYTWTTIPSKATVFYDFKRALETASGINRKIGYPIVRVLTVPNHEDLSMEEGKETAEDAYDRAMRGI